MKTIICTYCEGNDTKIAVVSKDKDKVKILKAANFEVVQPTMNVDDSLTALEIDGQELSFEDSLGGTKGPKDQDLSRSSVSLMSATLSGYNLKKCDFIPALTEPAIYYHVFEGSGKSAKLTQEIVSDIQESKNVSIDKENLGYTELADKSILSVFLSGEVSCIKLINSVAAYNGKRYYKIPSVKSADISLAYYVAKRKKFFPDDNSLIVYIGKEYSKLIFLQGRKLRHIGATLDVGTVNLHTYDVYFSKILLEMENGGISSLDNIIVCGEDDSENLILSFYGTFPEANVSRLEFDELDLSLVDDETKEKFSAYSIPISTAIDYIDDLEEVHKGINLLPKYVKEDQKVFQFAWHGFAMLPVLFVAAFFITQHLLVNQIKINKLNEQITEQTQLLHRNQAIVSKISNIKSNIANFAQTQTILDSASSGTGVWSNVFSKISNYFGSKKDMWLTALSQDANNVVLRGYSENKRSLTDFAYYLKTAELKSVTFESLREKNAYKFNLTFNKNSYQKNQHE